MTRLECIEVEKQIYENSLDCLFEIRKAPPYGYCKGFDQVVADKIERKYLQYSYACILYHQEMVRLYPTDESCQKALQYAETTFKEQKECIDAKRRGGIVWIQPTLFEGEILCKQYGKNR